MSVTAEESDNEFILMETETSEEPAANLFSSLALAGKLYVKTCSLTFALSTAKSLKHKGQW